MQNIDSFDKLHWCCFNGGHKVLSLVQWTGQISYVGVVNKVVIGFNYKFSVQKKTFDAVMRWPKDFF